MKAKPTANLFQIDFPGTNHSETPCISSHIMSYG